MRKFKARCIVEGNANGEVLSTSEPIAFLRGVDPEKGMVCDEKHELFGKQFVGKILVFPNSVGSSVGAYVIYRLKRNRKAPRAIINQNTDIITASGCAIAGIPLYDVPGDSLAEFRTGMKVAIDSKTSEVRIL
ncbi:MAG: aconitase X swivel domain-containing protein [Nitrososphaerales archaeon]